MDFEIETDHKPLVSLLGEFIDELPLHIQHFRMRLMKFSYRISHIPGKNLVIADALLEHHHCISWSTADYELKTEVDANVNAIISSVPTTDTKLEEMNLLNRMIQLANSWPSSA